MIRYDQKLTDANSILNFYFLGYGKTASKNVLVTKKKKKSIQSFFVKANRLKM